MKLSYRLLALAVFLAASVSLSAQALPMMKVVEPSNAKVGDLITVTGENLDKEAVAKLILSDGKTDFPVAIAEQDTTTLKFKIPTSLKAGKFSLILLTKGKEPKEIEQPVRLTVEE